MKQNENLIEDPSHWMMGIVSFNASLGASSLVFSRPDGNLIQRADGTTTAEDRSISFTTIFERTGRWDKGRIVSTEKRTLVDPSYNLADMFNKLNPSKETFSPITAQFQTTPDGSSQLTVPLNRDRIKKSLADSKFDIDEVDYRTCTECTLSTDLLDYLDMTDQPIKRFRRNLSKSELLGNMMNWFAGPEGMFDKWRPLRFFAAGPMIPEADVVKNLASNSTVKTRIPDAYFTVNGIDPLKIEAFHSAEIPGDVELEIVAPRTGGWNSVGFLELGGSFVKMSQEALV